MFMLLKFFLGSPVLGGLDSAQPEGKRPRYCLIAPSNAVVLRRGEIESSNHALSSPGSTLLSVGGMTLNPCSENSVEKPSTAKLI